MYKQLSGGFGNVQVVLKELLDGEESFLIQTFDRALYKYLAQEHVAQRGGQLVDKSCDAKVVKAHDVLLGVEHLADLKRDLSLLEGAGKILDADNGGADADRNAGAVFADQSVNDGAGKLFEILGFDAGLYLLNDDDIALRDAEDKVLLAVGEEVLDNVISGNIVAGNDIDKENDAAYIGVEMKLTGLNADIAGEYVIENDILDEIVAVVLFIVILLDAGKGDSEYGRVLACDFICTFNENRIVGLYVNAEGLICISVADKDIVGFTQLDSEEVVAGAYSGKLAAGYDCCVFVNNADNSADGITHLMNYALK